MKYLCISSLQTKNNQLVSLYVPLPVFVGGKWSRGVVGVPQLATFCHQVHHACHLPAGCHIVPQPAAFLYWSDPLK